MEAAIAAPTITFARETFEAFAPNVEILLRHWQELGHSENAPFAPDFLTWATLEDLGRLKIFTTRIDDLLIGYAVFILVPDPISKDRMIAVNALLWLDHAYRRGFVGINLMKFANEQLSDDGAEAVNYIVNSKFPALSILLERSQFERTSEIWEKQLRRR